MKKIYQKPETTTVLLLGTNAIMAGSGGQEFINIHSGGDGPSGGMQ